MDMIVKGMASLTIPEELLKELDVPGLLRGFKEDYDNLDNLKRVRKKHEGRNVLSRWWNSDEIDNAQLDATELQASFTKKLGQLWLISHAQACALDQQQQRLQSQQHLIEQQTRRIAAANATIVEQQKELGKQQEQLEKLIKDYFDLKGLTMDGARQLIQIAEEIKGTKSSLIASFENQHQAFLQLQQCVDYCVQQQSVQTQQMDAHREQVGHAMTAQSERFDTNMEAHRGDMDEYLRRQGEQLHAEQQSLKQQREQQVDRQRQLIEQQLAELKANIATQVTQAKRLAIVGLCGAGATLLWLLYEHRAMIGL